MLKRYLVAVAALSAVALVAPGVAHAGQRVKGHCGIHIGKGIPRHFPLNPVRYHVTIGVKNGGVTGPRMCSGLHHRTGLAADSIIPWHPFSFPRWNWHHVLSIAKDSTFTAVGCGTFATSLAAEGVSFGVSTALLAVGGGACADGVYNLGQQLPGTRLNPRGVRLIK